MLRPGDANEVAEAWRAIMPIKDRPVALVLTRQNLPTLDRTKYAAAAGVAQGGVRPGRRRRRQAAGDPDGHRQRAVAVRSRRTRSSRPRASKARVVSMPSWELFEEQDAGYRDSVLPPDVTARVAVEAGGQVRLGALPRLARPLRRHDRLRRQRPGRRLYKHFGITADAVVAAAKEVIAAK